MTELKQLLFVATATQDRCLVSMCVPPALAKADPITSSASLVLPDVSTEYLAPDQPKQ
jgi:hypothetical protein